MRFLNTIELLSIIIIFITTACGQSVDSTIENITREVAAINSDFILDKVELENEEFLENMTDGGGKLTGFFKDGTVKKIRTWVGLSNGYEIIEFYFKEGRIVFIHEEFYSFVYDNQTEQFNLAKTEKTFEGKYYFYNQKLIDYKTTGHNRFEDDSIDPENILLTEAKNYLDLLTKKN